MLREKGEEKDEAESSHKEEAQNAEK